MSKLTWIFSYMLISTLTFAYPSKVKTIFYRPIYKPMTITFDKKSPAYIAFTMASRENTDNNKLNSQVLIRSNVDTNHSEKKFSRHNLNETKSVATTEETTKQYQYSNLSILKNTNVTQNEKILITGNIEFSGGLALTPEHTIEIRRRIEGVYQEAGNANINDGSYKIEITSLSGELVAELRDSFGEVIGDGVYDLKTYSNINFDEKNQTRIKGNENERTIVLRPTRNFYVRSFSYYDSRKKPLENGKISFFKNEMKQPTNKKGNNVYEGIAKNSTALVKIDKTKFLPTNSIISTNQHQEIPLYPSSMILAFNNLLKDERYTEIDKESGIVIGNIKVDGNPLSNTRIEIEGHPELSPIYFNALQIPDFKKENTSENGMFSFVNIPEGYYSILATRENKYIGHANIVVEKGTISNAEINSTIKRQTVLLRAYDAFNLLPVESSCELQGAEGSYNTENGTVRIDKMKTPRQSLLICQNMDTDDINLKSDYVNSNYIYNDDNQLINIPRIKEQWLSELLNEVAQKEEFKLTEQTKNIIGNVIGFVPQDNYTVIINSLIENDNRLKPTIVYFDNNGKTTKDQEGIRGGGFLITNISAGPYEIIVESSDKNKRFSQVIPVDEESVTTLLMEE